MQSVGPSLPPEITSIPLDPRKMQVLEGVKKLTQLFQIEVGADFSIERCVIDQSGTMHSFGFFDKVHSQIESEGFSGLRGYTLQSGNSTIFFTYQETIRKTDIPTSVINSAGEEVSFDRIICLEDIIKHPQKDIIFKILQGVSDVEKQNRKDTGILTTAQDEVAHKIIETV